MIVGIDLGTTHCVVAHGDDDAPPALFAVPQLVADGQVASRPLLPSCLYAPLAEETPGPTGGGKESVWACSIGDVAGAWWCGEHARVRGGELGMRAVSSAKSWLSYPRVDRRAAILPWRLAGDPAEGDGDGDAPRISPVAASALLLEHLRRAWDAAHPAAPLARQEVVLTVPASFDAVARELTVMAARSVGLEVRLLEEPQAAFYELMRVGGDALLERVMADGAGTVLVVDVGGGTTDLSLMRVTRGEHGVEVARVAVGKHLLLGGDNMDLALAHVCERRLAPAGQRLDERRFTQLTARCRAAKERLLAGGTADEERITLLGSGSKLVGATQSTQLSRAEVESVVLDGFFPIVSLDDALFAPSRAGIVAFGLPYERDVAITRHIAAFVRRHAEAPPSALLLNGGVFRSPAIAARVRDTVASWTDGRAVQLDVTDPDTSVALGAVAYGLALRGRARRIVGGAAQSFYLGIAGADGPQALCVLAKGTEEGARQRVDAHPMRLIVGRRVRFDLYAADRLDEVGRLLALDDRFDRLAPLVTMLPARGAGEQHASVVVEAELSAVGTLELGCVETGGAAPRRFALAFDLRAEGAPSSIAPSHAVETAIARYGKRLDEARALLGQSYAKPTSDDAAVKEVKGLWRGLEKIFGKRDAWDATLNRALFDALWEHRRGRRASAEHERVFWMLAGYTLRPGAGDARDEERTAALFRELDQRVAHKDEIRNWQQFWIAWRRVAAGLSEQAQTRLRDALDPFLAPEEKALKKPKPFRNEARWEMIELAASLERVAAARRGELGGWIIEHTWTERDARLWAALGRIGARTPMYASAHHAVAARTVERWLDHLWREKWELIPSAPRAAVAMCRITGDRARDVSDETRDKVAARLEQLGVDAEKIRPIRELCPLDDRDRADFYGADLPLGLVLA